MSRCSRFLNKERSTLLNDYLSLAVCSFLSILFARSLMSGGVVMVIFFGCELIVEVLFGAISHHVSFPHYQDLLILYYHRIIAFPTIFEVLYSLTPFLFNFFV